MVRTDLEIRLLKVQQDLYDMLAFVRSQPVVSIRLYRKILAKYLACNFLLREYRTIIKRRNIA